MFCSAFVSRHWLFTSSRLEWTGEITPSVVLHIADVILMWGWCPSSEVRLALRLWCGKSWGLLRKWCTNTVNHCDGPYNKGRAFIFGPEITDVGVTNRLTKGSFKTCNCVSWFKSSLTAVVRCCWGSQYRTQTHSEKDLDYVTMHNELIFQSTCVHCAEMHYDVCIAAFRRT